MTLDFYEGMPKELPEALKQVGAMVPSLDKVAGRLGGPAAPAPDVAGAEPPAIEN